MDFNMRGCNSSNVESHGYDKDTKTLAVTFKGSGATYHYSGVPADTYDEMCCCESVGKFMQQKIKNNFQFSKVAKASGKAEGTSMQGSKLGEGGLA